MALKRTFGSVFLGQQISFPNSNFGYKSTPPQPRPVYGSKTYIWEGFPAAANRPSNFEFRTQKYPPAAWTSLWFQNVHLGGFSCSSKSAIQIRGSDTITHPQSGLVSLKKYIWEYLLAYPNRTFKIELLMHPYVSYRHMLGLVYLFIPWGITSPDLRVDPRYILGWV